MSKKILSIVLALVLVLSMGTVALFTASAELPEKAENTNRYFFYLPDEWKNDSTATTGNTAGIYWWEGTDACGSWPGYQANAADVDGVFYYDVPTDVTTIIWNNFFDGGADTSAPYYADAIQTRNIGCEYYEAGESELYPDGTDSFDGMIYIADYSIYDYSDYSGKMTFAGEWFYYYGNGEYGTTPEKGDDVRTEQALNQELGLPKDTGNPDATTPDEPVVTDPIDGPVVTDPVEPTTPDEPIASEPVVTEPVVDTEPAGCDTNITIGDKTEAACIGETITYTVNLKAAELFEDTQALITYDADKLEVLTTKGSAACPNLPNGLVFNAGNAGTVKFNASFLEGFDFTEEKVYVTLEFTVKAAGDATIDLVIEEMTLLTGDSYFTDGEPSITDGITVTETLDVPVHPTEPKPTEPKPVVTEPKPVVTEPKPVVTKPVNTDATSITDTTTTDKTDAPNTGATAYIYIALAVVVMAAAAVVVLRKKVNG